jgi:ABC-type uncharacterized transport system ATPase subunit
MCGACSVGLTVHGIVDMQILCLHVCIVCEGALVYGVAMLKMMFYHYFHCFFVYLLTSYYISK